MNDLVIILISLFIAGLIMGTLSSNEADPKRGCEASAYLAAKNGFDLEENLKACKNLYEK